MAEVSSSSPLTESNTQPLNEMVNISTPLKERNQSLEVKVECKTPPSAPKQVIDDTSNTIDNCKCKPSPALCTPDRLKVPKPFKYPERYTSPTDHMMSPISKGLLARSRRGGALLPPSKTLSKVNELRSQT
ncbi:hypothetical protein RND81_12G023800 [Saponaria officinalis]|uniref:Uncharacterized protein n=1 Tax=Saponaria officinalis TaxID=3572 RepID=A0AAW1H515_SAPOF